MSTKGLQRKLGLPEQNFYRLHALASKSSTKALESKKTVFKLSR